MANRLGAQWREPALVCAQMAVLLATACTTTASTSSGALEIVVESDMNVPQDIDRVDLLVTQPGRTLLLVERPAGSLGLSFPATFEVQSTGDSGPVTIQARAYRSGELRIERDAVTPFPDDGTGEVTLLLDASCVGPGQPDAQGAGASCPDGQSCVRGVCVIVAGSLDASATAADSIDGAPDDGGEASSETSPSLPSGLYSPLGQSCTGPSSQPCGSCGTQTRACADGQWGPWSSCTGEGACQPAATEPCGVNGERTCGADCQWTSCGCPDGQIACAGTCVPAGDAACGGADAGCSCDSDADAGCSCDSDADAGCSCGGDDGSVCESGACACAGPSSPACGNCGTRGACSCTDGSTLCGYGCVVGGCATVVEVAAGASHTCALLSDGTVECWGDNSVGELGNGSTVAASDVPVAVPGLAGVMAISAGLYQTCALLSAGTVECWGSNSNGQLGNGTTTDSPTPVPVGGNLTGVTAIAAGSYSTCALLPNGQVACWGRNRYGELGNGTTTDSPAPVYVTSADGATLSGATSVSVGNEFACAIIVAPLRVIVPPTEPPIALPVTDSPAIVPLISRQGVVECWGANFLGQLGLGSAAGPGSCSDLACSQTPVQVTAVESAVLVSAGDDSVCALEATADASSPYGAVCWGDNAFGQLGIGSTEPEATPTPVSALEAPADISVGDGYACALGNAGTVECWGGNTAGTLGSATATSCVVGNTVSPCSLVPVEVTGLGGVTSISAGAARDHTCAVLSSGAVECWGQNVSGQLGNGTTTASMAPVPVQL